MGLGKGALLWLIGIPLPVIILLALFRVLYTTGYARNAIVHQGRLDPGVHLLAKPYTYAQLARKLRDVLDGST